MTVLEQKAEQRRNWIQRMEADAAEVQSDFNSTLAEALADARTNANLIQGG